MEFKVYQKELELQSRGWIPTFHDVSKEIREIVAASGVKIITVTENLESPLAKNADVVLKQHVNRETDKYNAQGTTSSTALCMIFHALQTALIEETDYKNEQFALIHPGGAVGERLNK